MDFAFTRFFKGLGGYPKFKASRHYSGWTYPCKAGWKARTAGDNGCLELSNLGSITIRGKARTWGTPTTCTIVYRNGKWYASITVQCQPVRLTDDGTVGIDLGCVSAITLSTGEKIAKPDFIKQGQQKVKASTALSFNVERSRDVKVASKKLRCKRAPNRNKKIKASRRWRKARQQVSKLQRKVARQREDWLHQITSNIVSGNSLVAGEQLNVKGMTRKGKKKKRTRGASTRGTCATHSLQKAGLNRSILDVGFGMIGQMIAYKQAEAGGFYVESPTKTLKPTQRCAKCWELTPKALADRIHICSNPACQHTEDRDVNAAQVNLIWASGKLRARVPRVEQTFQDRGQELSSSDVESPSSISCRSMRQLGAKKRQKSQQVGEVGLETPSA